MLKRTYNFERILFEQIDFFFPGILTEYFNCKYLPICTPERLGYLLGISPSRRNPCGGNSVRYSVQYVVLTP